MWLIFGYSSDTDPSLEIGYREQYHLTKLLFLIRPSPLSSTRCGVQKSIHYCLGYRGFTYDIEPVGYQ